MFIRLGKKVTAAGASVFGGGGGGGGGDAKFLGIFATPVALEAAKPQASQVIGTTAGVTSTETMWFINDSNVWVDSLIGFLGDMLKSVYDPTTVGSDAFSMGNMAETGLAKVLTGAERTGIAANTAARHAAVTLDADDKTQAALILTGQALQIKSDVYDYANATGITQGTGGTLNHTLTGTTNNFNPVDFLTYNYFIFDMSADRNFTGWEAPPAGVERIIKGVNVSDKKIKFKDNDGGSVAANRLRLKDYGDKDCKKGEPFAFRYIHSESRWFTEIRIG